MLLGFLLGILVAIFLIPRASYFKPCESPKLGKRTDANIDYYSICCFYPVYNHGLYIIGTPVALFIAFSYEF